MKNALLLSCIFILRCSSLFAQNFDTVQIKSTKITESIYMLEGSGGNIGVLAGKDGIILIDDQFAPLTEKIKKALSQIGNQPIRFVINTHFHFDHTGGNENLGGEGAIIVAHENSRRRLNVPQLMDSTKSKSDPIPYNSLPKVTFTDSVTFHMNGQTINVFYAKNAHTDGDVIIHFKEANVFHGGDVFVRYGFPYIDQQNGGSIEGMIKAVDKFISITNDRSVIIPGHGAISSRKDLIDFRTMLVTVRDRVAKLMKEGKTLQQIIDEDPLKGYTVVFDKSFFIEAIYNSIQK
jgi:cyclase